MKFELPSIIVQRNPPKNLSDNESHLFSGEFTKKFPEVHIDKAHRAFLTPSGQLFKGPNLDVRQFNIEIKLKDILKNYFKSLLSILSIRRIIRVEEAYYFTNFNTTNFFHWFLDALQKLEFLSGVLGGEAKDHVFVIPADHQARFIIDSLSAFGFNFIIQDNNQLMLVNRLTVVPDIAPTGNYRKEIVLALRERLRSHFLSLDYDQEDKIKVYITRKNSGKRKIINESELFPILQASGFKVVDMDCISFAEQIRIMIGSDVLISLHGAGLTHMLWMEKANHVLEIRARDDAHNNCYFSLASDLGSSYFYALADKTNSSLNTQQSDYIVNPQHFEQQLLQMLKQLKD